MKYTLLAIFFVSSMAFSCSNSSSANSSENGIKFKHTTLEEALKLAKKEKKVVFVDAYTSWCGPCRKMARLTFTDEAVGSYYNANFINLKIDMEKGEGPSVANKYKVDRYPTLLYLEPDGTIRHKAIGYHKAKEFVRLGKKVNR